MSVFAVETETEFWRLSAALVILAKLDTFIVSLTRNAEPASELLTTTWFLIKALIART